MSDHSEPEPRSECAYCGRMAFVSDPSPVWDDEAWVDIAEERAPDCEWVMTRAHMCPSCHYSHQSCACKQAEPL